MLFRSALKGFEKYIDHKHPPFVLEVGNTGSDAHSWLCAKGYSAISLSSYSSFKPEAESHGHSNVLYIHPLSKRGAAYRNCEVCLVGQRGIDGLIQNGDKDYVLPVGKLDAGRYIVEIEAAENAKTETGQFEISVGIPKQLLTLHIAPMNFLAVKRWQLPIHIDRPSEAYILMKRLSESVVRNGISGVKIFHVRPGTESWS